MNDWQRSLRQERDHHQHQQRSKMPSFSSSLLDSIYRSIDEKSKYEPPETTATTTTKVTKKQRNVNSNRKDAAEEDERSLRKALAFEKLMESNDESRRSRIVARGFSRTACNSASSSSDSSCGGVFSSSETDSVSRDGPKSVSFTIPRPDRGRGDRYSGGSEYENTPKRDERLLMRTKSKALKLYGDLKKVKQPISPGRRITSFLNSLFNSRNAKNRKRESLDGLASLRRTRSVKDHHHHHQTTTCSLSSSFSRSSCLPPSSTSRSSKFSTSNNSCSKRSVRFCLVDEDPLRRCGKKEDPRIMPTPIVRKIAEITVIEKEVVKSMSDKCRSRGFEDEDLDEDEEEYDDGMSCTSSDLFELENIGASAGVGSAYREELPVYGTTSLNGLIL